MKIPKLPRSEMSPAQLLAELPEDKQREVLATLTPDQLRNLQYDWKFWARPKQYKPISEFLENDKTICLVTSGRGFGKTRVGAQWVDYVMANGIYRRGSIIAPTVSNARRDMIMGDAGLINICPPDSIIYEPSKTMITWPAAVHGLKYDGIVNILSADDPARLRGLNNEFIWADELAAWDKAEDAWDMLMFTLRTGESPKALVTSTPQPLKLIAELLEEAEKPNGTVMVIEGSTYENAGNINKRFLKAILQKYEDTDLGDQEIHGKLLKNMGGLFKPEYVGRKKIKECPEFVRTVISIDPAAASKMSSNETAIAVASKGSDGNYYLRQVSAGKWTPKGWADEIHALYKEYRADCIVAEINQGGEMVEHTIQQGYQDLPVKVNHTNKGKELRAQPISLLYQKGKIFHVTHSDVDKSGNHVGGNQAIIRDRAIREAEKQMYVFRNLPNEANDKVDAIVYALLELSGNDFRDFEVPAVAGVRQSPAFGFF
jgi:phage terminase large subunit-like protein